MVVRDQHGADRPCFQGHGLEMSSIVGARVDDGRRLRAHDPCVRALERIGTWVGSQNAEDPEHRHSWKKVDRCKYSSSPSSGSRVSILRARTSAETPQRASLVIVK